VAQTGFLLLGFGATSLAARAAVLFYLAGYVFMTIGAFAALAALSRRGRVADRIDDFAGLAHERPLLAAATTVFLLSLAGVPGTVGFAGKFQLLAAAVRAGRVELALLAAVSSLVLFAAYLRIPVLMVMRPRPDAAPHRAPATGELLVLGICALVVLTLGIAPDGRDAVAWLPPVIEWSRAAVP
jgi:NADH-quinone oxidoreductase subunit N